MHVLMTVNSAWNIANFRLPLVAALLADGHQVTVLAPPDDAVPKLEAAGCRVLPLKMDVRGLNPISDLGLVLRLRRIFKRERPDVVLSFTIKNNIFGAFAAKPLGIPFIPNVTGLGTAFLSGGALQRVAEGLYCRAFRKLPAVLFQNAEDRELFLKRHLVTKAQARLVPGSGIDLAAFEPAPWREPAAEEGPVFLMIARLLRDKGVYEYIEAARRLRQTHPGARFRIIGAADSDNRSAISAAEAARWVEEGIVEWPGPVKDVRPHIAAADCIVLPSYREGAPRVLIEAGALARPVIATNVPGCNEVVTAGKTGLLCAARDGASLAEACTRFAEMPKAQRQAMGRAGRERIETHYDVAHVARIYREVISLNVPKASVGHGRRVLDAATTKRAEAGLGAGKTR